MYCSTVEDSFHFYYYMGRNQYTSLHMWLLCYSQQFSTPFHTIVHDSGTASIKSFAIFDKIAADLNEV